MGAAAAAADPLAGLSRGALVARLKEAEAQMAALRRSEALARQRCEYLADGVRAGRSDRGVAARQEQAARKLSAQHEEERRALQRRAENLSTFLRREKEAREALERELASERQRCGGLVVQLAGAQQQLAHMQDLLDEARQQYGHFLTLNKQAVGRASQLQDRLRRTAAAAASARQQAALDAATRRRAEAALGAVRRLLGSLAADRAAGQLGQALQKQLDAMLQQHRDGAAAAGPGASPSASSTPSSSTCHQGPQPRRPAASANPAANPAGKGRPALSAPSLAGPGKDAGAGPGDATPGVPLLAEGGAESDGLAAALAAILAAAARSNRGGGAPGGTEPAATRGAQAQAQDRGTGHQSATDTPLAFRRLHQQLQPQPHATRPGDARGAVRDSLESRLLSSASSPCTVVSSRGGVAGGCNAGGGGPVGRGAGVQDRSGILGAFAAARNRCEVLYSPSESVVSIPTTATEAGTTPAGPTPAPAHLQYRMRRPAAGAAARRLQQQCAEAGAGVTNGAHRASAGLLGKPGTATPGSPAVSCGGGLLAQARLADRLLGRAAHARRTAAAAAVAAAAPATPAVASELGTEAEEGASGIIPLRCHRSGAGAGTGSVVNLAVARGRRASPSPGALRTSKRRAVAGGGSAAGLAGRLRRAGARAASMGFRLRSERQRAQEGVAALAARLEEHRQAPKAPFGAGDMAQAAADEEGKPSSWEGSGDESSGDESGGTEGDGDRREDGRDRIAALLRARRPRRRPLAGGFGHAASPQPASAMSDPSTGPTSSAMVQDPAHSAWPVGATGFARQGGRPGPQAPDAWASDADTCPPSAAPSAAPSEAPSLGALLAARIAAAAQRQQRLREQLELASAASPAGSASVVDEGSNGGGASQAARPGLRGGSAERLHGASDSSDDHGSECSGSDSGSSDGDEDRSGRPRRNLGSSVGRQRLHDRGHGRHELPNTSAIEIAHTEGHEGPGGAATSTERTAHPQAGLTRGAARGADEWLRRAFLDDVQATMDREEDAMDVGSQCSGSDAGDKVAATPPADAAAATPPADVAAARGRARGRWGCGSESDASLPGARGRVRRASPASSAAARAHAAKSVPAGRLPHMADVSTSAHEEYESSGEDEDVGCCSSVNGSAGAASPAPSCATVTTADAVRSRAQQVRLADARADARAATPGARLGTTGGGAAGRGGGKMGGGHQPGIDTRPRTCTEAAATPSAQRSGRAPAAASAARASAQTQRSTPSAEQQRRRSGAAPATPGSRQPGSGRAAAAASAGGGSSRGAAPILAAAAAAAPRGRDMPAAPAGLTRAGSARRRSSGSGISGAGTGGVTGELRASYLALKRQQQ